MVGEIVDWAEPDPAKQTLNNTVADCRIYDLPREFHGAVSVSVFVAAATSITHNEIAGSSYSAISVGWGWHSPVGNFSDGPHQYMRDNAVSGNHIHDSMQLLFDGGDIYTLGSQPGSEISFNWIHGHHDCVKTNALYHDDGSAHFSDHHNVVQLDVGPTPCPSGGRGATWADMWTPYIHDCHLYHNFADTNKSGNAGTNCTITDTTIFSSKENIPAEAQTIMAAAGPRRAMQFVDSVSVTTIPSR